MRVFVAGATGAIGRPLVRALRARGHTVVGLARSDENVAVLSRLGAEARRADLFDAASLAKAMAGADVVVRAATHIPTGGRPRAADWEVNDRIRRAGTRALLEAARRAGVGRYLQESIVWLARPADGAPFDEASPPSPDRITRSALDAERAAEAAGGDLEAATLRLGWLYGAQTAHTRDFARGLLRRRLPVVGKGDVPLAFLHVEDAAEAFAAAAEAGARGVYHVVDDRPGTLSEFLGGLADGVGAPAPMRVPKWLGRLAAGGYVVRFLTTPMVTGNERLRQATGWAPRYPSIAEGVAQVAEAWREEGFPRPRGGP